MKKLLKKVHKTWSWWVRCPWKFFLKNSRFCSIKDLKNTWQNIILKNTQLFQISNSLKISRKFQDFVKTTISQDFSASKSNKRPECLWKIILQKSTIYGQKSLKKTFMQKSAIFRQDVLKKIRHLRSGRS